MHYVTFIGNKILNKVQIRHLGIRIKSWLQEFWNFLYVLLWYFFFSKVFLLSSWIEAFWDAVDSAQVSKDGMFLCGKFHDSYSIAFWLSFCKWLGLTQWHCPAAWVYIVSPFSSCFQSTGGESHTESNHRWYSKINNT